MKSGVVGDKVINDAQALAIFEKGSSSLNQIGEILDSYANESITHLHSKKLVKIKGLIGTIASNSILVRDASVELSDRSKEYAKAAKHNGNWYSSSG